MAIYSVSSSMSGVGWGHCSHSLRSHTPLPLAASHLLYCSRVMAPPGDWGIQALFPSLGLVSISWAVDSLGDQKASLNLLLFQLGGTPTMLMRLPWELSVVRLLMGKVSIKYSFYKIRLCSPSWGRIIFFSWIFVWSSLRTKNIPWETVKDISVYHKQFL